MPIQISCPSCSRQLRVPDNLIGQTVRCPTCQNTFTAAVEESAAPSPREEARPEPRSDYREEEPRREREEPRRSRRPRDDDDDDRPRRRRDYKPHRGMLILILGILGLVGVGSPITGILAWIFGNNDLKEIREGRMDPEGESNTNLGRILGMISTLLWVIGIFGCCCIFGLAAMKGH